MLKDLSQFSCNLCNYSTDRKSSYSKHLNTVKHKRMVIECDKSSCQTNICINKDPLTCEWCGKHYSNRSGLWKHQPKCNSRLSQVPNKCPNNNNNNNGLTTISESTDDMSKLMIAQMLNYFRDSEKKQDEYRNMMERQLQAEREQCKKLMNTVQDMIPKLGNYNNSNININVFLQEHCKDALNLKDFVASLQIELNDISKFQDRSMIDAVGNVFVNGLRQLDLYKRPIHCTDLTQETLYIKENGNWENEPEDRGRLRGAITAVAAKQSKAIREWEITHPNWNKNEVLTNEYLRLVKATTCPIEQNSVDENKIIQSIAKEVVVDLRQVES